MSPLKTLRDRIAGLSDQQRKLLSPEGFYIDGWHNRRFLFDAWMLVEAGLLSAREYGDAQYTAVEFSPTPACIDALIAKEGDRG